MAQQQQIVMGFPSPVFMDIVDLPQQVILLGAYANNAPTSPPLGSPHFPVRFGDLVPSKVLAAGGFAVCLVRSIIDNPTLARRDFFWKWIGK